MTGACADMPSRTCSSSKAAAKQEEPCGNGDAIDDIQDKGQAAAAKAARAACEHGKQEDSDDDWETSPDEPEDPAARALLGLRFYVSGERPSFEGPLGVPFHALN